MYETLPFAPLFISRYFRQKGVNLAALVYKGCTRLTCETD